MMLSVISLESEFDRFWEKVLRGENFALIRNGDGERGLMQGKLFQAQEGWKTANGMTGLGYALMDSIRVVDQNYWVGISCPCCDPEAYKWYLENVPGRNITFANLWVNGNYQKFIAAFSQLERDAIVIANHRAKGKPIGKLNVLEYYCVSDDCVSFWEQEAAEMIRNIIQDYGDRKELLFVVSAGPMSGPIIEKLFRNNPNNCYLDFGSAIDSFYWGKITRPYMKSETTYANQQCWMFDPTANRTQLIRKSNGLVRKNRHREKIAATKSELSTLPQRAIRKVLGDSTVEKIKQKLGM